MFEENSFGCLRKFFFCKRLFVHKPQKKMETVCTPPPHHNVFKMITNYIVLAHVSFNATVRLKTR
jgi:hypothetical protein